MPQQNIRVGGGGNSFEFRTIFFLRWGGINMWHTTVVGTVRERLANCGFSPNQIHTQPANGMICDGEQNANRAKESKIHKKHKEKTWAIHILNPGNKIFHL